MTAPEPMPISSVEDALGVARELPEDERILSAAIMVLRRAIAPLYQERADLTHEIAMTHTPDERGGWRLCMSAESRQARKPMFERLDAVGQKIAPLRDALARLEGERKHRKSEAEKAREALQNAKRIKGKRDRAKGQGAFQF